MTTSTNNTSTSTTPTFFQWTADRVLAGLRSEKGDLIAMRAVCALFRQQTADERQSEATRHLNARGFSAAHAKAGSELAKWMSAGADDGIFRRRVGGMMRVGGKLVSRIEMCRHLAEVYRGQLAEIATANLAKRYAA